MMTKMNNEYLKKVNGGYICYHDGSEPNGNGFEWYEIIHDRTGKHLDGYYYLDLAEDMAKNYYEVSTMMISDEQLERLRSTGSI